MREYGQLQCSFWQSKDIRCLGDPGKLLAAYLVTGPHSNGIGCYWLPDGYVMADFEWSAETVSKAFEELSRKGFCERFESVIFMPNFLRWNAIANPNVALNRQKEFEALPHGEAKTRAAGALLEFGRHWSESFRKTLETIAGTVPKPFAKQDPIPPDPTLPNPTREDPKDASATRAANGTADEDLEFEALRALYPQRSGDQRWHEAKKAINARLAEGHTWEEILDGARRYAAWCRATGKIGTETVKQALTFVGPGKPFLDPFTLPATKAEVRLASNLSAAEEFMRRTEAQT